MMPGMTTKDVDAARERNASVDVDLGELEGNIRYCQQFVRRLLDFSRRPQLTRRVESIKDTLDSVLSFLSPQLATKQIHLTLDMDPANADLIRGANVPPSFVIIQRINLGLYAILGELGPTFRTAHLLPPSPRNPRITAMLMSAR